MRKPRLPLAALAVSLVLAGLAEPAAAARVSRRETIRQREAAKAKKAKLATQLNTLKASDSQLEAAVAALTRHYRSQVARAQATQQAAQAAALMVKQAQTRVAATQVRIQGLRGTVVKRAVSAYVRPDGSDLGVLAGGDLAAASRRQALLAHVAHNDRDILDQLRAAEEDQTLERQRAQRAEQIAQSRRHRAVQDLLQVGLARGQRIRLKQALDVRIAEFQNEVDGLAKAEESLTALLRTRRSVGRASRDGEDDGAVGRVSGAGLIWPARGGVTSGYGYRWGRMHQGIDIDGSTGDSVRAAKGGSVIYSGWYSGYGNFIVIDHGGGFTTAYAHLSQRAVGDGEQVGQGDYVGAVGSTGNSSGSHLHFETRINDSPQNPLRYLP